MGSGFLAWDEGEMLRAWSLAGHRGSETVRTPNSQPEPQLYRVGEWTVTESPYRARHRLLPQRPG